MLDNANENNKKKSNVLHNKYERIEFMQKVFGEKKNTRCTSQNHFNEIKTK